MRFNRVLRADGNPVALVDAVAESRLQHFGVVLLVKGKECVLLRTLRIDAADVGSEAFVEFFRQESTRIHALHA